MRRRDFLAATAIAPTLGAAEDSGFVSLFDGKSLKGWTIEQGPEGAFYVHDGAIVVHKSASFPTWLRSDHKYENFDFRGEFYIEGWIDSGIYWSAPDYGRNTWVGMQMKIFHQADEQPPRNNSMGSLFPLIAPSKINVKNQKAWNDFRIVLDWPSLKIWTNGELVQDLNCDQRPELRYRLRQGYLGLASLSYPIRFRNLRVRELPAKEKWQILYGDESDWDKWYVSDGTPRFAPVGNVLYGDGVGHLATKEQFRDFEFRCYVRGIREHNSGVLFRSDGHGNRARHYEIQLHSSEEAHYPTGSLYHFKRSIYPRIKHEEWFPFHLIVKGKSCMVAVNGDVVCEYDELDNLEAGHIELQAHSTGYWTEFRKIRIKSL